jgi:hypothetical protein
MMWKAITESKAGITREQMVETDGVSATHGALALTSK